jgi:DNA-binding MarR family transcriptional regulator
VNNELLLYQTTRIQDLMEETLHCCQMRTAHLSQKFRVPQAELRCLLLFRGERYLTVKSIAQKLEVAKSRVTKIISGLIQKRLVESMDDPRDARIKLLSLTPEGQKESNEIFAYIGELHQQILLELDSDQRKTVLASLELLRSAMEAVKRQLV